MAAPLTVAHEIRDRLFEQMKLLALTPLPQQVWYENGELIMTVPGGVLSINSATAEKPATFTLSPYVSQDEAHTRVRDPNVQDMVKKVAAFYASRVAS